MTRLVGETFTRDWGLDFCVYLVAGWGRDRRESV